MRILALDTATLTSSVALVADGATLAAGEARAQPHSEKLLPLVEEVLARAGVPASGVDAVACGQGPGSFTGLRIGLATAKALCFALDRPLVLVSSLAALALAGATEARRRGALVLAVLDARRHEVYAGLFDAGGAPAGSEVVVPPARLAEMAAGRAVVVVGDGAATYPEAAAACGPVLAGARPTPDAAAVAALAARRLASGERDDLFTAAPTYLRPPVG